MVKRIADRIIDEFIAISTGYVPAEPVVKLSLGDGGTVYSRMKWGLDAQVAILGQCIR